jgi:hypothetical protein
VLPAVAALQGKDRGLLTFETSHISPPLCGMIPCVSHRKRDSNTFSRVRESGSCSLSQSCGRGARTRHGLNNVSASCGVVALTLCSLRLPRCLRNGALSTSKVVDIFL